jgi:hypothetical protein
VELAANLPLELARRLQHSLLAVTLCVGPTTAKSVHLIYVAPKMDTVETQPIIVTLDVSQNTDLAMPTLYLLKVVLGAQVLEILFALITSAAAWLGTVALPKITARIQEAANWDTVAATQIQPLLGSRLLMFLDLSKA